MSIILGTMTAVTIDGSSDGFQSINWNINRQPNRLWQLGSWDPWKTQVSATLTVSVTSYAGALSSVALQPAFNCDDSTAQKSISIVASACDPGISVNIDEDAMFITSYSYSKGDPVGFGTESWSFQKWIESGVVGSEFISMPTPTAILQGISEGSRSGDVVNLGVLFSSDGLVTGSQGSVSAGIPGVGSITNVELGIVTRIGGGDLESGGKTGQSSASIPNTPIYISV